MTTESITDKGTATSAGRKKRNNGTATKDSPKPIVDRTKEAIKLIRRTQIRLGSRKVSSKSTLVLNLLQFVALTLQMPLD